MLERDPSPAGYVSDRLVEGWTPEQIDGHLKRGVLRGLRYVSTETIHAWIFGPGQKATKIWCYLPCGDTEGISLLGVERNLLGKLARPAGLEPATLCLEGRCSIRLS